MISGLKPNPGIALCFAIVFLGGCAVGPDYQRPGVSSPEAFRGTTVPATTNSLADLSWWDLYRDPVLAGYIRVALSNNYDVRVAVTRVEQARQYARQAKSQFLPSIGYQGAVGYGKNEFAGSASPDGQENGSAIVLANAFWEVDLWGRIRRLNESAKAQFLATEEARRGVQLSLVSGVAQAYFELLALDLQLEIARRTTNSFGETLEIFNLRFGRDIVSKLETARAEAALASAAATVPDLERQIALKENEISVLLGRPPGPIRSGMRSCLNNIRQRRFLQGCPLPCWSAGRTCARLSKPCVRQMRKSASPWRFFPKIGLTAFAGKSARSFRHLPEGLLTRGRWRRTNRPDLQGGALRAQYRQAKAAWEESCLQYEQTALHALQEVAGNLVTREKLEQMRTQQARAVAAYSEAVKISMQRYVAGTAQYFEALDAQLQLFPAENTLAQIELSRYLAVVQLYRALGGGWHAEDAE